MIFLERPLRPKVHQFLKLPPRTQVCHLRVICSTLRIISICAHICTVYTIAALLCFVALQCTITVNDFKETIESSPVTNPATTTTPLCLIMTPHLFLTTTAQDTLYQEDYYSKRINLSICIIKFRENRFEDLRI